MKNNLLVLTLVVMVIHSCISDNSGKKQNLEMNKLDQISIGQSKKDVLSTLGKFDEQELPNDMIASEGWYYYTTVNDDQNTPRVAVSFDVKSQKVISITLKPLSGVKEESLDYLRKVKFKNLVFDMLPLQRCQRDFIPYDIFYINSKQGIVIIYNRYRKHVKSIKWTSPTKAALETT
ncbi:MAG: hypothetical protein ACK41T_10265 [Pseudobdellovibrio sp.]